MSDYSASMSTDSLLEAPAYTPLAYRSPNDTASLGLPLTIYNTQIRKNNFDQFIATEMLRLRTHLSDEEAKYVADKLAKNPIEVERRTRSPHNNENNSNSNSGSECSNRNSEMSVSSAEQALREQRAASCRKSRINNKLKKTTLQYRNEFMTDKVAQMKIEMAELALKMRMAEAKFLTMGRSPTELAQLRTIYGVNEIGGAGK